MKSLENWGVEDTIKAMMAVASMGLTQEVPEEEEQKHGKR